MTDELEKLISEWERMRFCELDGERSDHTTMIQAQVRKESLPARIELDRLRSISVAVAQLFESYSPEALDKWADKPVGTTLYKSISNIKKG